MIFMKGTDKRIIIEEHGLRTRVLEMEGTMISECEYRNTVQEVRESSLFAEYEEMKPTYAELIDWIGVEAFDKEGNSRCDTTLKRTQEFCKKAGVNFEDVKEELENHGAFCDCEIVYNASDIMDMDMLLPLLEAS